MRGIGHLNWEEDGELDTYFNPGLCDHPVQIKDVDAFAKRYEDIKQRVYEVFGIPEIFRE